jgi:hypothetical protein
MRICEYFRWVAFGINPQREMVGADVMVMWIDGQNVFQLSDRFVTGYSSPPADTKQNLVITDFQRTSSGGSGKTTFLFKRAANTQDTEDLAITRDERRYYWLLATGPGFPGSVGGTLSRHTIEAVSDQPLAFTAQSQSDSVPVLPSEDENAGMYDAFELTHGSLMFLAWSVFMPAAIICARYGKIFFHQYWFILHWGFTTLALVLMTVALVFIFLAQPLEAEFHSILGLIVVGLTVLYQIPWGVFIDRTFDPNRTLIPIKDKIHWWSGRIIFTCACVAVPTGIWAYAETGAVAVKVLYFIWTFVVLTLIVVMFEVMKRRRTNSDEKRKMEREVLNVDENL